MRLRPLLPIVLLLAAAPCRGQDSARWIADLGDAARGEAAEIALLAMGERAAPLLISVMEATGDDAGVRRARQVAALRVLALLGPDAAAVGADLAGVAVDTELLLQWVNARAALEPWAHSDWQPAFHKHAHEVVGGSRGDLIAAFARHQGRSIPVDADSKSLLERLAGNRVFERAAVADLLSRSGDVAAVEPLCRMLRECDVAPDGHDSINHNGFAVPIEDGFRFAAAEAVLRLAPDDPRAAIAWSGRARLHPHHGVRGAALAALARFAPDIDDTVPDLVAIARGDDAGLAVEAIKLLGMARSGGAVVAELEQLAAVAAGDVAARARQLVARLHAAGVVARPLAAPAADPKLVAAVAALQDGGQAQRSDAWPDVFAGAGGDAALPLLLERLRVEHDRTPEVVVAAIARIGRSRAADERTDLRAKLYLRFSDTWNATFLSCSTSGARSPSARDLQPDGELALGDAMDATTLALSLDDDNPFVRLVAAQRLAQSAAVDPATAAAVRERLLAAARAEHPKKWTLSWPRSGTNQDVDVDAQIHAAAAAALVAFELPAELRAEFLPLLLAGDDEERIAQGVRRWADARTLPALGDAALDPRPRVAVAAVEAIGSLGKDGAPASKLLQKLAGGDRPDVTAAAQAALQAVGH